MKRFCLILGLLAADSAWAAGRVDPDWPCIQRRQPSLSIGQLWPGEPPTAEATTRAEAPEIDRLAQTIALRRTPMTQVESLVEEFKATHPPEDHTALFLAAFTHIQSARDRVLEGINRYAHKQAALDAHINESRQRFQEVSSVEPVDYDQLDQLEAQLEWSTRIFIDRQQSLTYVCETPVILEQRGFALGRLLAP